MKALIDRAYVLFSIYQVTQPLDVCTECCMNQEDASLLATLPVKEIPADLLMKYTDSAKSDKTPINEIKHFLPRYLELISNYVFPSHAEELSLTRLPPLNDWRWTEQEREMLKQFAVVFFEQTLHLNPLYPPNVRIDTVLILFWRKKFDLHKLLRCWERIDSMESVIHFNEFYFRGFKEENRNELRNSFADGELSSLLMNWITSHETRKMIGQRIEKIISHDGDIEIDPWTLSELEVLYEMVRVDNCDD